MNDNNFNPRTIVAIGLSLLIFIVWQHKMAQKQNEYYKHKKEQTQIVNDKKGIDQTKANNKDNAQPDTFLKEPNLRLETKTQQINEQIYEYENTLFVIKFSSINAAIISFTIKNYKEIGNNIEIFKNRNGNYSYAINSKKHENNIHYTLNKKEGFQVEFVNGDNKKTYEFFEGKYYFKIIESRVNVSDDIYITMVQDLKKIETSFLKPASLSDIRSISYYDNGNLNSEEFSSIKKINQEKKSNILVKWVSMGNKYFQSSIILEEEKKGRLSFYENDEYKNEEEKILGEIRATIDIKNEKTIVMYGFIGPKEINTLKEVNDFVGYSARFEKNKDNDYGWFAFLAIPLLKILKFIHSIVKNWGVAIIILTILIKLVLYPLTTKSLKAMKDMQKIQPEMKKIKEKYKDDREAQNKETMLLMKRHKVNPFGSCFPMLLQMPVFFALYRLFAGSVELYKAPFIFWITDLSVMDKFWVLPITMGVAMVLQQKMTPTTGDPMQAKMMMFMPVMFTFIMITLPAGLNLYFLVNTLFSILQQVYIHRALPTGLIPKKNKNEI